MIRLILLAISILYFSGCSSKEATSSKPAIYWYTKLQQAVVDGSVDSAEEFYNSLQGEHFKSPLLKEAMLIMAQAHIKNDEYILANYYLDEYIKRFATPKEKEYAEFLKLKANYDSLKQPKRDQKLLIDTKNNSYDFVYTYPNSNLEPFARTIIANITVSEDMLNKLIAKLYQKLDKPKGAKFYKEKINLSFSKDTVVEEPKINFIRKIFE